MQNDGDLPSTPASSVQRCSSKSSTNASDTKRPRTEKDELADEGAADYLILEGRAVCTICYPGGFDEATATRHGKGYLGVFEKSNYTARKRHSALHDEDSKLPPSCAGNEQKQEDWVLDVGKFSRKAIEIAVFWCVASLAFALVENPASVAVLCPVFASACLGMSRHKLRGCVVAVSAALQTKLISMLKGRPCMLMVDGGTLLGISFLNCCISFDTKVFFWKTVRCTTFDAVTIREIVGNIVEELREHGAIVIGVVSDNASPMVKALAKRIFEEDTNEYEQDDDEIEEDEEDLLGLIDREDWKHIDLTDAFDEDRWQNDYFFFHVRCWTHSLQLLFGDIQKKCTICKEAFECASEVQSLLTKVSRAKLANLLKSEGETKLKVPKAADTRWNSYIRLMLRIIEIPTQLNMILPKKLQEKDLYSMQVTILVCSPICWATDASQRDDSTVLSLRSTARTINKDLDWLNGLSFKATSCLNDVQTTCNAMKKCVNERFNKNFTNGFTKLADMLDPRNPDDGDMNFLIQNIEAYFNDCKTQCNYNDLLKELNEFKTRSNADRCLDHHAYWFGPRRLSSPYAAKFVEMVLDALLTEASVERSYKSQKALFRPDRSRANDETLNAQMMVKCNFTSVTTNAGTVKKKILMPSGKQKTNTITRHDWEVVALQLAVPESNPDLAMTTRKSRKNADALNLTIGSRVRIAWDDAKSATKTWFDAVVTGVEARGKYRVVYAGETKTRMFEPLTKDPEWTIYTGDE